jgi:ribosomal protein S11
MLCIATDAGKMGVRHVEVRVNAKGYGKEVAAIRAIAIEEIPIVKIPICPRIGNGLRGLVDRIIIAFGQH